MLPLRDYNSVADIVPPRNLLYYETLTAFNKDNINENGITDLLKKSIFQDFVRPDENIEDINLLNENQDYDVIEITTPKELIEAVDADLAMGIATVEDTIPLGVLQNKNDNLLVAGTSFQNLGNYEDLYSTPEDPYATDDDIQDPEYQPEIEATDLNTSDNSVSEEIITISNGNDDRKKVKLVRKKQKHPEEWRRNVIKKCKNSGKSYVNWKGKNIPSRNMKAPCRNCRLKCTEKIDSESRKEIFTNYWALSDVNRQRDYIARFVEFKPKSRNRKRTHRYECEVEEGSRRVMTFFYFLPNKDNTGKIKVCKKFFLNTLDISSQVIKTVRNKMGNSGQIEEDKRGRVARNSKVSDETKRCVRRHINSFEAVDSHYCRKNSNRLYLPPTLSVSKMYDLYLEFCKDNSISEIASESIYRQIFTHEFNISFFSPKKDLCDICHKYMTSDANEKFLIQEEFDKHLENKNLARDKKNIDKERASKELSFCAAVFDLQQILPVPKTDVGLAYYKLKLSNYNFTVYSLGTKDCYCYMWHECIANRGSSEIGSCLLLFITNQIKNNGVKEFSFYSDNCVGQNRNRFIFALYNYLSQKYQIIIRHTFLERGHTQNEGDSAHSVIERAAKNIPIYTPDQWITLVRTARRNKPYHVQEITQENVYDLKDLLQKSTLNWEKDEINEKVLWQKIRIVESNVEFPNILLFKYEYSEEHYKKINLLQKGRKRIEATVINAMVLKQLYTKSLPITKKKYEHLMFLCKKGAITPQYHCFFEDLPHTTETQVSDSEDD
ncbi:hypothetical protein NQ314_008159 [Rhamnusium bicolor]|uniref:DUF7869 domain-containing protein n=1 Tax=Rhamnusium bicolor TaxID=1586634 RepID=A0AAV8YFJ1_9CUCU|nr:hypothetical protein NQ314_008159 [Rhamnusium bicolor]